MINKESGKVGRKIRYMPWGFEYIEFSIRTGKCLKVIYHDTTLKYLKDFQIGYERKEKEMRQLGEATRLEEV